jgi:hypothetical protein
LARQAVPYSSCARSPTRWLDFPAVTQFAYYVYYRVAPAAQATGHDAVQEAQSEVAAASGTTARLLTKHGEPDLWLEVYEGVTARAPFERALERAVERHRLSSFLADGATRNIEIFVAP